MLAEGRGDADTKRTHAHGYPQAQALNPGIQGREGFLNSLIEHLSLGGQKDSLGGADKELGSQLLLQFLYGLGDGGLADIELRRRP